MEGLDIKYSVDNLRGDAKTSRELVIMNWEPEVFGGLF